MKKQTVFIALSTLCFFLFTPHELIHAKDSNKQNFTNDFPNCSPPSGTIIDSMESIGDWHTSMGNGAISCTLSIVDGYQKNAIELKYDLGILKGAWVQIRYDFNPPLNLSDGDHIRFYYKGTTKNTLEIGMVSNADQNYFASNWESVTHISNFTYATWDLQDFRLDNQHFPDDNQVKAIFISVCNKNNNDIGGQGSFIVDEIQYLDIASRDIFPEFENINADTSITNQAAKFIASQQQDSLLKSWKEETSDLSWLYDQAIGLIVLSETNIESAQKLAHKLIHLQNSDGSWYSGYDFENDNPINFKKPIGANAWVVYALYYYYWCTSDIVAHNSAIQGANWLAILQREDGSLPGESSSPADDAPTEANLDAWWAFHCTGLDSNANKARDFLLNHVWDDAMGRFKSGPNSFQIFLDNQTWGAAFLQAIHLYDNARRALSYASWNLTTQSYIDNDTICGFDGGGPFGVWNEGTLQYIAAGGENSQYFWQQMVKQQDGDGGLPGSPDSLSAYMVWLTKWHGIAPTSWLYFAGTGGPFRDSCDVVTRINENELENINLPRTFSLYQNYPNPFNPLTKISYFIPKSSFITLKIFNIQGQEVRILVDKHEKSGKHSATFDASQYPTGLYFYRLQAEDDFQETKKMLFLK